MEDTNYVEIEELVENTEPTAESVCACGCVMCFTIEL